MPHHPHVLSLRLEALLLPHGDRIWQRESAAIVWNLPNDIEVAAFAVIDNWVADCMTYGFMHGGMAARTHALLDAVICNVLRNSWNNPRYSDSLIEHTKAWQTIVGRFKSNGIAK